MNFLKLLFPGSWIAYLATAAAIFLAGTFAGTEVQAFLDAPVISRGLAEVSDLKASRAADTAAVRAYEARLERDRADANARALADQSALQARIRDLQASLSAESQARQRASTARLEALRHVPQSDTSLLGPGARDFLRSLRDSQTPAPASDPTPP